MTSEFLQGRIDRLLEQAGDALDRLDWAEVRARAQAVLPLRCDERRCVVAAAGEEAAPPLAGKAGEPEVSERARISASPASPESFAAGR